MVAVLVVVAVLVALPPVRDRVTAAAALAEAVGVDVPRPFASDVVRREMPVDDVPADLYDPGPGAPGLLLVPGAAPAGRDDERVVRLAEALARSDLAVLVPELELYDHRFAESDLDVLVDGVRLLHDRSLGADVTILGISFGGSLALVAAADAQVRDVVGTVATFGSYADLVGLVQAAATGVSVVAGRRHPWDPPAQAREALARLAVELTPAGQQDALRAALSSGAGEEQLPPAARAAYHLVTVEDPDAVRRRVARLPPESKAMLERFSPVSVAEQLDADVLALHSRDDPAVPYAELLRLAAAVPDAQTYTVESFRHVDLQADSGIGPLAGDLWTAWRFAGDLIAATG